MEQPILLELFCGTKCISNAFKEKGWKVFTIDWDSNFEPDLCGDIGTLTKEDIIKLCGRSPDVIWASPDCTTYSVAAISHHRTKEASGNLAPKSEYAMFCDDVNKNVLKLIDELKPKFFFIENPRGGFRKMDFIQGIPRYTVTYCQYGDIRMKPTDIFTNHPNPQFKPPCKNGAPCHQAAPRGSKTGTQGLKGKKIRSMIPQELCRHIATICSA